MAIVTLTTIDSTPYVDGCARVGSGLFRAGSRRQITFGLYPDFFVDDLVHLGVSLLLFGRFRNWLHLEVCCL